MVSHYACCLTYDGLWWVSIPDFDKLEKSDDKVELKMKCVFTCDPVMLPPYMGIFSSGQKVFMVGGNSYHPIFSFQFKPNYNLFVLDPADFEEEEFPVKNPQFLYRPIIMPPTKMRPILAPKVFQANNLFYLIAEYDTGPWRKSICFLSFDPTDIKSPFRLLQPPFSRPTATVLTVVAHFATCNYIYLFIQEDYDSQKMLAVYYSFKSLKWVEIPFTLKEFTKKRIPLPLYHSGDTGVSQEELPDAPRILVAFSNHYLTAYRVTLSPHGHLKPISYRYLDEINPDVYQSVAHLHEIGTGRFCAIYRSYDKAAFEVSVFKIDFAQEHDIQIYDKVLPRRKSSEVLCSRKFLDGIPRFYAYCLASAPASQSSANQIAAAEE